MWGNIWNLLLCVIERDGLGKLLLSRETPTLLCHSSGKENRSQMEMSDSEVANTWTTADLHHINAVHIDSNNCVVLLQSQHVVLN